jgi:hypothetical protein
MDPSLDREKKLWRGRPKRVDCCGSLCAWNNLETFSIQRVERAFSPGASHLIKRHTSKRSVCADIR